MSRKELGKSVGNPSLIEFHRHGGSHGELSQSEGEEGGRAGASTPSNPEAGLPVWQLLASLYPCPSRPTRRARIETRAITGGAVVQGLRAAPFGREEGRRGGKLCFLSLGHLGDISKLYGHSAMKSRFEVGGVEKEKSPLPPSALTLFSRGRGGRAAEPGEGFDSSARKGK